jgi:CheY-like chemotaxis protein
VEKEHLLDGKTILIVDDEPDVLEALEDLLPMCQVTKASTFEEAWDKLGTHYYDMAILDIMGVDGYRLLELAKTREVPAVMLTAHALSPDHIKKSYEEGAASYVPKDEMANITVFLTDILEAKEQGKHPWYRWLDRLGANFVKRFGTDWQMKDKDFWDKFTY